EARFAGDPDVAAFLPFVTAPAPVTNLRTGDAKPSIQVTGVDFGRLATVGGLRLTSGGTADAAALGQDGVFLSKRAADDLRAMAGDTLTIATADGTHNVSVVGIVVDELASGVLGLTYSNVPGGLVMPIERVRALAGLRGDEISSLTV